MLVIVGCVSVCVASQWYIHSHNVDHTDDTASCTYPRPDSWRTQCLQYSDACWGSGMLRPQSYQWFVLGLCLSVVSSTHACFRICIIGLIHFVTWWHKKPRKQGLVLFGLVYAYVGSCFLARMFRLLCCSWRHTALYWLIDWLMCLVLSISVKWLV